MLPHRSDGCADPTEMARHGPDHAVAEPSGTPGADGAALASATAEQEAKRIEKIRSHASSHRTAGTVTLDS